MNQDMTHPKQLFKERKLDIHVDSLWNRTPKTRVSKYDINDNIMSKSLT